MNDHEPEARRILRLITRLNIGGPARQALLLSRELAPEFHTTLAAGRPAPDEGQLSDPSVPVVPMPLVRPLDPLSDARAVRRTRALLVGTAAELVHTHMAKAGTVGRIAARTVRPRPRTVHTFHGHVLDGYFRPSVQRAFVETERLLARSTDVLVAVSPQIRDQLLDLRIGRPSQYRVLSLGLELDRFLAVDGPTGSLRRHLKLSPDTPLIGAVGRLVPIKDLGMLLAAVAELPLVHVALIGDGESRPALEASAADLGILERVHFVGWWDDIPDAMSDLDVVALTSRNEGTPAAIIEALAAARPVVATAVGGVTHAVTDGETGLLAPAGQPAAFAARLRDALSQPARQAAMAREGRERVRSRFGSARLVAEVADLYRELLGRG